MFPTAAIIGAGPAGFFLAADLLRRLPKIRIDLFNRTPAPFGLVRYGVAPDHPKIKSVAKVFQRALDDPRTRYFGNVTFGRDILAREIRERYSMIAYAVGASSSRLLGIPGEEFPGVHSAASFVGWFNGDPEHRDAGPSLNCESAVVVGNGNVALDVARILVRDPSELGKTDISDSALALLAQSRVRRVSILGRRGPAQASFTNPELKEFGVLAGVCARARAEELQLDPESRKLLEADPVKKRNLATLKSFIRSPASRRRVDFRFLVSPVEISGSPEGVTGVRIERNRLVQRSWGMAAQGTGETETIPCGLIVRAVGYLGVRLEGVPYSDRRGVIPHRSGRVVRNGTGAQAGEYVVGWAKRGPSGVIGTNKADAAETAKSIAEDWDSGAIQTRAGGLPDTPALLRARGVRFVDASGWRRLDDYETRLGKEHGRPRVKIVDAARALRISEGLE